MVTMAVTVAMAAMVDTETYDDYGDYRSDRQNDPVVLVRSIAEVQRQTFTE